MNPLAKLDDMTRTQRFGVKPVCYENVSNYNYIHSGSVFIPCHGMTPNGLRAQYLIPNLSLSAIAYPSIRSFRLGHVTTQSCKISANSFLAEQKPTADRRLLCRIFLEKPSFFLTDFFTKLGPQFRLLPVLNFGVNSRLRLIWYKTKSNSIIYKCPNNHLVCFSSHA
jgi:hypothetical protein